MKIETAGIDVAMLTVMREIGAIGKNQKNAQQNFNYRGISDIYDAAHAAMVKAGVYMQPEILSHAREERTTKSGGNIIYTFITVRYRFVAADGSFRECVVPGEGMDSGDKSSNKAMAAAHKYAITQTFVIPYSEMVDGDAEMPEQSTKGRPPGPDAANKRTGQHLPTPGPKAPVAAPEELASQFAKKAIDDLSLLTTAGQMQKYFVSNKSGIYRLAERYPALWRDVFLKRITMTTGEVEIEDALNEQYQALTQISGAHPDVYKSIMNAVAERQREINPFVEVKNV